MRQTTPIIVSGVRVAFTRRRYGQRLSYTWAHVVTENGERLATLGDPWPGVNWPKTELQREVALYQQRQAGGAT